MTNGYKLTNYVMVKLSEYHDSQTIVKHLLAIFSAVSVVMVVMGAFVDRALLFCQHREMQVS